jgi:hypothetical protein
MVKQLRQDEFSVNVVEKRKNRREVWETGMEGQNKTFLLYLGRSSLQQQ